MTVGQHDRLYQLNVLASGVSLQVQAAHSAMSQDPEQDVERAISVQLLYRSESSASLKSDSHFPKITEISYFPAVMDIVANLYDLQAHIQSKIFSFFLHFTLDSKTYF